MLAIGLSAPAVSAAEPTAVRVRTGVHEKYNRLVFDWPEAVTYRVVKQDGRAEIHFERPAELDLKRVKKKPPPLFKSVDAEREGETTIVHIVLQDGVTLRHYLLGTRVVIDVFPPKDAGAQKEAAREESTKAPAEAPADAKSVDKAPAADDKAAAAKAIPVPIAKPAKIARPAVTPPSKPADAAEEDSKTVVEAELKPEPAAEPEAVVKLGPDAVAAGAALAASLRGARAQGPASIQDLPAASYPKPSQED